MEIWVRAVKTVDKGALKAIVDVEVAGLVIRGLRVLTGTKGPWIAWPSKEWTGRDGRAPLHERSRAGEYRGAEGGDGRSPVCVEGAGSRRSGMTQWPRNEPGVADDRSRR
jgi:DNA-binding cell septation regulator SpoVG